MLFFNSYCNYHTCKNNDFIFKTVGVKSEVTLIHDDDLIWFIKVDGWWNTAQIQHYWSQGWSPIYAISQSLFLSHWRSNYQEQSTYNGSLEHKSTGDVAAIEYWIVWHEIIKSIQNSFVAFQRSHWNMVLVITGVGHHLCPWSLRGQWSNLYSLILFRMLSIHCTQIDSKRQWGVKTCIR